MATTLENAITSTQKQQQASQYSSESKVPDEKANTAQLRLIKFVSR
jgi:translation elongation factor EF-Tu-like GTPase